MVGSVPEERTRHLPEASQNATKLDAGNRTDECFVDVFDGFDEVRLARTKFVVSGFRCVQ
jgi:hypothetical protein